MQLSNNQQAFLALVRAGLWEKEVQLSQYGEIDYNEIYQLAEEQTVVGLVTAGIEHVVDVKVPQAVALSFVRAALTLEQKNKAMNQFIKELVNNIHESGIVSILLKGQGIARCYERPLWRECGDVDLLFNEQKYQLAKSLLIPKATSVEKEHISAKHLGISIGPWIVELHGRLRASLTSYINKVLYEIMTDTFSYNKVRIWNNDGIEVSLLSHNNDIIYIFAHYLNHFYKGGIGLRQICDWCRLLWTYRDSIDQDLLIKRLNRMGLVREWLVFGTLAVKYLGMPSYTMPLFKESKSLTKKADIVCEFIMSVGNFGHNRNTDYYKYPYILRKMISFKRRFTDLLYHTRVFPFDTLRFTPNIVFNGLRNAIRGE